MTLHEALECRNQHRIDGTSLASADHVAAEIVAEEEAEDNDIGLQFAAEISVVSQFLAGTVAIDSAVDALHRERQLPFEQFGGVTDERVLFRLPVSHRKGVGQEQYSQLRLLAVPLLRTPSV